MFVIRRKIGQSICIGDQIVVEVLDATPNRVKLGIHAPAEIRVVRAEVLIAEMQNREAAGSAAMTALTELAGQLRGDGLQNWAAGRATAAQEPGAPTVSPSEEPG